MEENEKSCTEVLHELIGQYKAGTLPEEKRAALEDHLVGCKSCREILALLLQADEEDEEDSAC